MNVVVDLEGMCFIAPEPGNRVDAFTQEGWYFKTEPGYRGPYETMEQCEAARNKYMDQKVSGK